MSAQQQLVELIRIARETPCLGSLQAAEFIRDHGPAIAELIEIAKKQVELAPKDEPARPESGNYDDVAEWAGKWEEWFSAGPLRAALRKLTQDATT